MFQITKHIWQGGFASPLRLDDLRLNGITHLVNVSDTPNQLIQVDGPFRRIIWCSMEDFVRIPTAVAIECLQSIHESLCDVGSNVYIHCTAGWHRSPTVVWLYLVACGLDAEIARNMIASASFDAVPAHPKLIDAALVRDVIEYGEANFRPHVRPDAICAPR